jgi:hypothetical protein
MVMDVIMPVKFYSVRIVNRSDMDNITAKYRYEVDVLDTGCSLLNIRMVSYFYFLEDNQYEILLDVDDWGSLVHREAIGHLSDDGKYLVKREGFATRSYRVMCPCEFCK